MTDLKIGLLYFGIVFNLVSCRNKEAEETNTDNIICQELSYKNQNSIKLGIFFYESFQLYENFNERNVHFASNREIKTRKDFINLINQLHVSKDTVVSVHAKTNGINKIIIANFNKVNFGIVGYLFNGSQRKAKGFFFNFQGSDTLFFFDCRDYDETHKVFFKPEEIRRIAILDNDLQVKSAFWYVNSKLAFQTDLINDTLEYIYPINKIEYNSMKGSQKISESFNVNYLKKMFLVPKKSDTAAFVHNEGISEDLSKHELDFEILPIRHWKNVLAK